MKLGHGIHLAYCTNIHRGETWGETFDNLQRYALPVRDRVCPDKPYAIGLRLSDQAARELSGTAALLAFRKWLDQNNCYIFTINGFPCGRFHGTPVKDQVYAPDWTTNERVEYTNRLFDLLAQLVPEGVEGSISTVPGSFKEFISTKGLEPEPLCYLETSEETVKFFELLRADRPGDVRLDAHLGVNYDTCHLAVEFEEPDEAVRRLQQHRIKISKLHFSSALRVCPTPDARDALKAFADDIYLHQVVQRAVDGSLRRYRDLGVALAQPSTIGHQPAAEWRIHFHIPLHSKPTTLFDTTSDHLLGVMDLMKKNPAFCSQIEMETYTWEVLPPELKNRNVVDQLVAEYQWTLARLAERGLAQ